MDEAVRRRQPNVPGGRKNRVRVQLSDDELRQIEARAAAENLTVSHYLVRTALGAPPVSSRAVLLELSGLKRVVATATSNLNQVAKQANSGSYDQVAHDAAVARIDGAAKRLNSALDKHGIPAAKRP